MQQRAPSRQVMDGIINLLKDTSVGQNAIAVGDGTDPNHEPPYLVVKRVTTFNYEGPFDNPDADEELRVMVIGVGDTREQADFARDRAREKMTKTGLTEQWEKDGLARVCMNILIDISYDQRFDRGRAVSAFSAVDQYLVSHTPKDAYVVTAQTP